MQINLETEKVNNFNGFVVMAVKLECYGKILKESGSHGNPNDQNPRVLIYLCACKK